MRKRFRFDVAGFLESLAFQLNGVITKDPVVLESLLKRHRTLPSVMSIPSVKMLHFLSDKNVRIQSEVSMIDGKLSYICFVDGKTYYVRGDDQFLAN